MSGPVERVGVPGCGLMGAGITEVCARAGTDVVVVEADSPAVRRGQDRVLGLHFFNPVRKAGRGFHDYAA